MKRKNLILVAIVICLTSLSLYSQNGSAIEIQRLLDGNKRFADGNTLHPNQSPKRINEIAGMQNPFAVILSCSDSRVPPEILFDQGLGDLFIIRTAGHVLDDAALGSIEYAVEHLGVKLIVVLGHERCGAVQAAVKGGDAEGHIAHLIEAIQPMVKKAGGMKGDIVENTIGINVKEVITALKNSQPILQEFVAHKGLRIIGARYDLDDGTVRFLE